MNEKIVCPYNTDHNILKENFQFHLVRCWYQHKHVDLVPCPYNATHLVKRKELFKHLDEECENRIIFERSLQSLAEMEIPIGIVPASAEVPIPSNEENWDDDVVVLPVKHVAEMEIPIGVVTASAEVPIPSNEENWDDDVVVLPVKHVINENVKKKPVMLNLVGKSRSQRNKHKAAERKRHADLNKQK